MKAEQLIWSTKIYYYFIYKKKTDFDKALDEMERRIRTHLINSFNLRPNMCAKLIYLKMKKAPMNCHSDLRCRSNNEYVLDYEKWIGHWILHTFIILWHQENYTSYNIYVIFAMYRVPCTVYPKEFIFKYSKKNKN